MDSVLQMPTLHPTAQAPAAVSAAPQQLPSPLQAANAQQNLLQQPPAQQLPPFPTHGPGTSGGQRFSSRKRSGGKKGPALIAALMAVLALAATAWFFRDQLKVAWRTYMAEKDAQEGDESTGIISSPQSVFQPDDAPPAGAGSPGPVSPAPAPSPPVAAQDVRPAVPVQPDASAAPSATPPGPPPVPPAPAPPAAPVTPDGLVEVPKPDSSPGPPVNVAPGTMPFPPASMMVEVPAEAMPAFEVLKQFLASPTWEDRIKVVQGAEIMKPLMQSYYASMPDGPLAVTKVSLIRHDKSPQTGPPHCVFQVGGGAIKKPLPIMVEETTSGWKVDWLTFTEFKDDLLARFMESHQDGPKRFHVLIRRTHYFDDDVPGLDKKICVEVQSPSPPFVGCVFARKGTPVAMNLERHLGWQDQAAAVVELEWRKEGSYQWVELTQLPQFNWRNADAGEVAPPVPPPPPAAPRVPPVALPVE